MATEQDIESVLTVIPFGVDFDDNMNTKQRCEAVMQGWHMILNTYTTEIEYLRILHFFIRSSSFVHCILV